MKNFLLFLLLMLAQVSPSFAQKTEATPSVDSAAMLLAALEKQFNYQTGSVTIGENLAKVNVPAGFRFLNAADAKRLVVDLWGNPESSAETMLGVLMPEKMKATDENTWAFIIEYDDMGFVKDDDATKINYTDLLKDMQSSEKDENDTRTKAGFPSVHLVGWAEQPYYDATRKVLHWAKELNFEGTPEHTLNYNVRVLGRKGVMVLNAVGSMDQLPEIKQNINGVLSSVEFTQGNSYADFNPSMDKVAAYGIGGLVAGKVLAKAGLFAILAKFGKVIIFALIGGGAAIWRWVTGRKETTEEVAPEEEAA